MKGRFICALFLLTVLHFSLGESTDTSKLKRHNVDESTEAINLKTYSGISWRQRRSIPDFYTDKNTECPSNWTAALPSWCYYKYLVYREDVSKLCPGGLPEESDLKDPWVQMAAHSPDMTTLSEEVWLQDGHLLHTRKHTLEHKDIGMLMCRETALVPTEPPKVKTSFLDQEMTTSVPQSSTFSTTPINPMITASTTTPTVTTTSPTTSTFTITATVKSATTTVPVITTYKTTSTNTVKTLVTTEATTTTLYPGCPKVEDVTCPVDWVAVDSLCLYTYLYRGHKTDIPHHCSLEETEITDDVRSCLLNMFEIHNPKAAKKIFFKNGKVWDLQTNTTVDEDYGFIVCKTNSDKKDKKMTGLSAGLCILVFAAILVSLLAIYRWRQKQIRKNRSEAASTLNLIRVQDQLQ